MPFANTRKHWGRHITAGFALEAAIATTSFILFWICLAELIKAFMFDKGEQYASNHPGLIERDRIMTMSTGVLTTFLILAPLVTLLISSTSLVMYPVGYLHPWWTLFIGFAMIIGWITQNYFWSVARIYAIYKGTYSYLVITSHPFTISKWVLTSLICLLYFGYTYVSVAALAVKRSDKRTEQFREPTVAEGRG